jgi:hypothetical protein
MCELVRGDGTGHADGERAFDVRVVLHRGPSVHSGTRLASEKLEHLGARRERRPSRAVERAGLSLTPHDKPGDAADAAPDG